MLSLLGCASANCGAGMIETEEPAGEDSQSATEEAYQVYKAGDSTALYRRAFLNQARASIWKNLGHYDPTLCHQIAQRGLLKVKSFRGESKVSTWFYRLAENECKRELRRLGTIRKRDGRARVYRTGEQRFEETG